MRDSRFSSPLCRAWRAGKLNMDVPISVGVVLALGMSLVETIGHGRDAYFDSAVMLLLFLLAGRFLDQTMRRRTRAAAANLAALKGETANRLTPDGGAIVVPVAALTAGDRILVQPGDRVPADGLVLGGRSEIDASLVTGETMRQPVCAGSRVYAGRHEFRRRADPRGDRRRGGDAPRRGGASRRKGRRGALAATCALPIARRASMRRSSMSLPPRPSSAGGSPDIPRMTPSWWRSRFSSSHAPARSRSRSPPSRSSPRVSSFAMASISMRPMRSNASQRSTRSSSTRPAR